MKKGNRAYRKGYRFEWQEVSRLKKAGLYATRTSGSHTLFDVISIDLDKKRIYLEQLKQGYVSPKQRQEILEEIRKFNGVFEVQASLIIKSKKGKKHVREGIL